LSGLSFGDKVEIGAIVGAGYRFDKRWFVDLRANYGLKKSKISTISRPYRLV
jgi:hypothetical protein